MSQQQLGAGGLAALACYTVDSDFSSDEEEKGDVENRCQDFADVYIKEEPRDEVEEMWSIDRQGVRDPTETAQEFLELQEVKVEIQSEDEESDSDTSSSDSDEDINNTVIKAKEDEEKDEGPPRTKNELCPKDLPPVEDLTMSVEEHDCLEVGVISSTVEELVVIESHPGVPALDLETVLFIEKGAKALGKVFDVIGPVTRPYYVIRFNNDEHIREKGISKGLLVYYAPRTEHTTFVFLEQLMKMKISDASWMNDEEPPPQFIEYSDDEEEKRAKKEKKAQKKCEKTQEEGSSTVKRGRYEDVRGKHGGREGRGRGNSNGGQPAYCNSMYTAQTNPFYRSERGYDPRQGQISWGQYHVQGQYYQYPQQYNTQHTQYTNTPTNYYGNTQYSSNQPHHALAGGGWHSQYQNHSQQSSYQELSSNIAKLQQPPPPPPPAPTSQPPPPSATYGLLPPPPPPGTE